MCGVPGGGRKGERSFKGGSYKNVNAGTRRRRRKKGSFGCPLLMHQDLKLCKRRMKTFATRDETRSADLQRKGNIQDRHVAEKHMRRPTR